MLHQYTIRLRQNYLNGRESIHRVPTSFHATSRVMTHEKSCIYVDAKWKHVSWLISVSRTEWRALICGLITKLPIQLSLLLHVCSFTMQHVIFLLVKTDAMLLQYSDRLFIDWRANSPAQTPTHKHPRTNIHTKILTHSHTDTRWEKTEYDKLILKCDHLSCNS